jgi:putative molybdopterin biosynthesis protein
VKNIDTHSTLLTPPKTEQPELIISGQDVVLDILANYLQQEGVHAARTYLNSFEGLLSLYQDNIHVAACHLYDGQEYNASFVRSLMPGVSAVLVNVSYRTQGFYVQKGNPKNIRGWEDLARRDITVLNRRVGSSARILMDVQLKRLGISGSQVAGYDKIMKSHLTMAAAIAAGEADLAIGTERISRQIENLDFIPLLEERFDFVIKKELFETEAVQKLVKVLNMPAFRREIAHFSGNDYRDLGKVITEV